MKATELISIATEDDTRRTAATAGDVSPSGLPARLSRGEIERLGQQVNFEHMPDPANVAVLGHLSREEREEFASATGSLVLYIGDEVAACKRDEERAALTAAPADYPLAALNGLNIGCGDRLISTYLTPVDVMRDKPGTAIGGEHPALTPGALLALPDELPFRPNSLDYIVALHALEHMGDPVRVVLHWLSRLKPGGGIGIVLPHWRYTWDARNDSAPYGHKWNPSPELVERLYQQHWREHCTVERFNTLDFKISFDVVLRKHGTFAPFSRERLERSLSGQQLAHCGMFLD